MLLLRFADRTLLPRTLADLTDEELGANGQMFLETDPIDWFNQFAVLQVLTTTPRQDPLHFDGGASFLHMAITLYGRRHMEFRRSGGTDDNATCDSVDLAPGNVYIGSLCAVARHVIH